jgi:hypothetical protein
MAQDAGWSSCGRGSKKRIPSLLRVACQHQDRIVEGHACRSRLSNWAVDPELPRPSRQPHPLLSAAPPRGHGRRRRGSWVPRRNGTINSPRWQCPGQGEPESRIVPVGLACQAVCSYPLLEPDDAYLRPRRHMPTRRTGTCGTGISQHLTGSALPDLRPARCKVQPRRIGCHHQLPWPASAVHHRGL